jgi:protein involved in temperature-dependent protein secretion
MAISEHDLAQAEKRMQAIREDGYALSAWYDRRSERVVIELSTGIQVAIPAARIEGLAEKTPADLTDIEISPAGLGLHWPRLDVDVYLPSLMNGVFGSRRWMATQLGQRGGQATSPSKVAAARENGRRGGRPRKIATG